MENKVVYLVYFDVTKYDSNTQFEKFVTLSEEEAKTWVDKFNRLRREYLLFLKGKITKFGDIKNRVWEERYSALVYECPTANYIDVEFRV